MIFQFDQHMADKEKERGRLFSIQIDGSDSVPFIIKKDSLLIGRGDSCEIRIYVEGVAHEHCILTFNEDGRGFVEPVNKCGLTFLNGDLIERQVSLEHNDVITVVKRSFRFYYPSSSKFYVSSESAASFEDNMVKALEDFEVEDAFSKKGKDISEKRVTFGPRLSPEEFDKRMPPASPLRKGSLPRGKLKAKTSSFEQDVTKSQIKKNLFMNSPANKVIKTNERSAASDLPESSVVLKRLKCSSENVKETKKEEVSKPSRALFSEIVKKSAQNPVQNIVQKYSPQKFIKKTKLKDKKKIFHKSPRRPVHPRVLAVGSTGHANSPETIVICKKRFSPNSPRNPLSSIKRRKSLRLLQEKVVSKESSESRIDECSVDMHEKNLLMPQKYSAIESIEQNANLSRISSNDKTSAQVAEVRRSSATKWKINDENKDDTPANIQDEDTPFRKIRENNASRKGEVDKYASRRSTGTLDRRSTGTLDRRSTGTLDRKSTCTPARKSTGTPARKSVHTPARKNVNTPARKSIHTPARKCIHTPARKCMSTPDGGNLSTPAISNHDEMPNALDEEETEREVISEEVDESEAPSNSSSLVAAINNVAQIDENNLDKSLKDIHNIVQALSCHSNVPTLSSDRLTADMCTNAVKKLALTISMINAFHMYNRIIDDVSTFPLCFPSTSFESNRDSLRRMPRASHQNEDFARMSRFQDIMQSFFSNSSSSERRRMLRTSEDGLNSNTESSLSNKKPKRSSSSKMPLRAIDAGHKTPTRKSSDSQVSFVRDEDDVEESNYSNQTNVDNEIVYACSTYSHSKSLRTPISNKEENSPASTSGISELFGKDSSLNSSSLHNISADELSFSSDVDLQKSTSSAAGTQNFTKAVELDLVPSNSSSEKQDSPKYKKLPHIIRRSHFIKISPKKSPKNLGFVKTAFTKILRNRKPILLKPKPPRVSFMSKKLVMTTSKKLKAQKKEQRHRRDVLKKVEYRVVSPKIKNFRNTQKSPKLIKASLKRNRRQSNLVKPKIVRLSQKIIKKAKSKKKSSVLRLSGKLVTSPKGLKVSGKRKSVIYQSKRIGNKSSRSSRLSSQKKKSSVSLSSPEASGKRMKRNRSVIVQSDVNKNDSSIEIKTQSIDNDSVKVTAKTRNERKRKISGGKFNSDVTRKEPDVTNEGNDVTISIKHRSTEKDLKKNAENATAKNQRKRKKSENSDFITAKASFGDVNKENDIPVEIKNQSTRKKPKAKPKRTGKTQRKTVTEKISEHEQPEQPKIAEKTKNKGKPKTKNAKARKINIQVVPNEEKSLSEEITDNDQMDKKLKIAKRNQTIETKVETPKLKRNTRTTRRKDAQNTEMSPVINDLVDIKAKKRTARGRKDAETKKSLLVTSPSKKNVRTTRRRNLQTMKAMNEAENKEVSIITETPENAHETKTRKRKVGKTVSKTLAKIPNIEEEKVSKVDIASAKNKKNTSASKDTPKKVPENVHETKTRKRKGGKTVSETPTKIPNIEEKNVSKVDIESAKNKKNTSASKDTPNKVLEITNEIKARKRKVCKTISKTLAKIPNVEENNISEVDIASERNKKNTSASKDTPKKGRSKGVSKRVKAQKEVSPVQRVQRSLRSRK